MKTRLTPFLTALAAVALVFFTSANAMAMTKAGTDITNAVTLTYNVNNVEQDVEDAAATFRVDNIVNLSVTSADAGNVTVLPGGEAVLTFTLTNNGNFPQGYTAQGIAASGFDFVNFKVYFDADGDGLFDINEDTEVTADFRFTDIDPYEASGEYKDEEDRQVTLFIVASGAPEILANTSTSTFHLLVTTLNAGTNTETAESDVDKNIEANLGTQLVLFADAGGPASDDDARDGKASAAGTFVYSTTTLDVTKTVAIIWDPVNLDNSPMAIPGAIVEYTITITNEGGAGTPNATDIALEDILPSGIEFKVDAYGADDHIELRIGEGAASYNGTYDSNDRKVSVNIPALLAEQVATIKFQAEIQ